MSKEYPDDMDFRKSMPCPHCGKTVEEFNVKTRYIGCPNCEKPRDKSLAIMRLTNFRMVPDGVRAELRAGPELIMENNLLMILIHINADKNKLTVDGVNYDSYEVARQERLKG